MGSGEHREKVIDGNHTWKEVEIVALKPLRTEGSRREMVGWMVNQLNNPHCMGDKNTMVVMVD